MLCLNCRIFVQSNITNYRLQPRLYRFFRTSQSIRRLENKESQELVKSASNHPSNAGLSLGTKGSFYISSFSCICNFNKNFFTLIIHSKRCWENCMVHRHCCLWFHCNWCYTVCCDQRIILESESTKYILRCS